MAAAGLVAVLVSATSAPVSSGSSGAGPGAEGLAGRPLFVTNGLSHNISPFTINRDGLPVRSGELIETETGGPGEEVGPGAMVISPDGRFAYVTNRNRLTVDPYAIGADGGLTPLSPVSTGADTGSYGLAISPDGGSLYVANANDGTVSVLALGDDGVPTLLGEPVATGVTDSNPRGVAATPDGRFLYVGHSFAHGQEPTETDVIVRFTIEEDGALGERSEPITVGGGAESLAVSPGGRYLYVATSGTDQVFAFRIGAKGGVTAVPGSPFPTPDFPDGIVASPDGHHLFVAAPMANAVAAYAVRANGSLAEVKGSPFTAGELPAGITTSPDGRFLHVSNVRSADVSAFAIQASGALASLEGSPVATDGERPLFQATAIVPNQGPTAAFLSTVEPAGEATVFDATASADPDGGVTRYDWDFGDGTVLRDGGPNPEHVYRSTGSFTATLTVTDDEGCSTERVFTGQLTSCNGSAAARATRTVLVN